MKFVFYYGLLFKIPVLTGFSGNKAHRCNGFVIGNRPTDLLP